MSRTEVPGQEFINPVDRMVSDMGQDMRQPSVGRSF